MPALYVSCVFNILSDQFCRLITNTRTSLLAEADHVIRGSRDQVFEALLECVQSVVQLVDTRAALCLHYRWSLLSITVEVAVDPTGQIIRTTFAENTANCRQHVTLTLTGVTSGSL